MSTASNPAALAFSISLSERRPDSHTEIIDEGRDSATSADNSALTENDFRSR